MKNQNIKGIMRASLLVLFLSVTASVTKAQSTKASADVAISTQNTTALKAALSNPAERIKQIQLNTQLSPKQKQQQMDALFAKRRRAVDSLLTPEQKKVFLQQAVAARQTSYGQTGSDTSKLTH